MRTKVIGQTGKVVLSDEMIAYKMDRKRTVRYQYTKVKHGFICWVCGPFHSRTYGACGFGTKKVSAKRALIDRLARDYRYIGCLLFSDVDESDNVGNVDTRLLDENSVERPISFADACGKAGQ